MSTTSSSIQARIATRAHVSSAPTELQAIVDQAPFGVCVLDARLRLRTVNSSFEALFHDAGPLASRDVADVLRAAWPESAVADAVGRLQHCLETGGSAVLPTAHGRTAGYHWQAQPLTLADGTPGLACFLWALPDAERLARDRGAAHAEFLTQLQDTLANLTSGPDLMHAIGERIGRYMNVAACYFCDIDDLHDLVRIEDGWRVARVPPVAGRFRLSEYLGDEIRNACREGATVAVQNTQADARTAARPFAALGIHSFVMVPFGRDGEWKYVLGVTDDRPREWREDEVALFRELSSRVFPRLERAQAEAAVARDLQDTRLLRDLGATFATEGELPALYDDILDAAIALTEADAGTVQILDPDRNELALLATKGFTTAMTDCFQWVGASSDTSCGIALATNVRTFVEFDDPPTAHLEEMRLHVDAGYRTAQSTPLVTRSGRPIGMVSTHWRASRHRPDERQLRFLDLLVRQTADLLERRQSELNLRDSQDQLEAELADTKRLQELSAALVHEQDASTLFQKILGTAASLMGAQYASLQLLDSSRGKGAELRLLASKGFTPEAIHTWRWVTLQSDTACGVALRTGRREGVPDIDSCAYMAGTNDLEAYRQTGIQAMQTTPLVTRSGETLGMISTHWRYPHDPSERSLRLFDILARQAADFLERTKAAEALRKSQADLREADRRKDEFLAVLAHELRNPLAPIRTGLELIRMAADSPEAVKSVREMLDRQVGHMVRLIDDLLEVSRITSGTIRLQLTVTSLADLVNTAVEAHRAALDASRIDFAVDLPHDPIWLNVDPTRLVQVLSNVLHNAVKFTGSEGRVRIAARLLESSHTEPGPVEITITDSGPGISKDMLARVFDLFTQDKPSSERPHKGLGIGLALSRKLLEMHGGAIEAHSDGTGQGSTFTIRLPATLAAPDAMVQRAEDGLGLTRRVLVVDDNEDAANAMAMLVDVLGGESRVAFDGETGLEEARAFRPDVVLLDIGLPGMDGYEVCRLLRDDRGSGLTVVALTGWGQERDKAEALRAGFDAHLTKPADIQTLKRLLADSAGGVMSR